MNDSKSINSNSTSTIGTNSAPGTTEGNAPASANPFRRLFQIDVSAHVEKKGPFSYLSWPFAVAQLRLADPQATWEVKRFHDLPYLQTDLGFFVEVAVTVQGVTLSQIHPVLDGRNRPIPAPTPFDINTSIQRALVKAIALHGLGLGIYAGEDLPLAEGTDAGSVRLVRSPDVSTIAAEETTGAPPVRTASEGSDSVPPISPIPSTAAPARVTRGDTVTPAQVRYIQKLIAETGTEVQKVLDYFGVARIEEIAKAEASRVIRSLEQQRDQRAAERRAA